MEIVTNAKTLKDIIGSKCALVQFTNENDVKMFIDEVNVGYYGFNVRRDWMDVEGISKRMIREQQWPYDLRFEDGELRGWDVSNFYDRYSYEYSDYVKVTYKPTERAVIDVNAWLSLMED